VGAVEFLGAVSLLIPRLAGYSAAALGVVMIGALVTQLVHRGSVTEVLVPLVFLLLLSVVAYARRPGFLRRARGSRLRQADDEAPG
jgi:hypothetical protein